MSVPSCRYARMSCRAGMRCREKASEGRSRVREIEAKSLRSERLSG
jgi:hypothetical protein